METQDRIALAVLEKEVVHLDKGLSEVKTEIKELRTEFKELRSEIGKIKDSLASAKIWALILYIGMGTGLLALIAKSFQWI